METFKVEFMADIKSTYLQCLVITEDHKSLKFLWFRDGDPKKEVIDMCMTSQAFGVTSSGGNAGYLLWCMALNNHTHSSKAMTETVRNNVYVDDIPKSHCSVSESIACISELVTPYVTRWF